MTTLQEQFEKDFPDKGVEEIRTGMRYGIFTNWDLDLREYVNLTFLDLIGNNITSVDFLNTIPNPEKLETLWIWNKDKWITALTNKITNSQKELQGVKDQEADKTKKIARLESKISELEQAKQTISQQTQTEFSTQNKSTQTDLTMEQIKQWEQADKNKTLYQKYTEKYGKK